MAKSVAILGSGNMAFQLLTAFDKVNIPLKGLISRDLSRGDQTLQATKARCELVGGRDLTDLNTDIIILAVPDDSIPDVMRFYQFRSDQIIVHTSGAEPMNTLSHDHTGVFYPLQTFTWGEPVDFNNIPILIESSDQETEEALTEVAKGVSRTVKVASSEDRLKIHVAAVFVSNFTNHMYRRADDWLRSNDFSLDILYPLMEETLRKTKDIGPKKAQTGPAKRGDDQTIDRHMALIDDDDLKRLYKLVSDDIRRLT